MAQLGLSGHSRSLLGLWPEPAAFGPSVHVSMLPQATAVSGFESPERRLRGRYRLVVARQVLALGHAMGRLLSPS